MTIAFAIGLPAGISQRVFDAYQQGFWGSALLAVGRLAALAGILLCVFLKLGLPYLSATAMGIPFIATAAGSILIFKDRPWLVPSLRAVRWTALSGILRTGLTAVAIHVSYALVYSGPAIIIANRLGAAEVTPFAVTQKLLGVSNMLLAALVLPLWPAYGEAAARGDWSWVKKTVRRTMLLGAALQVPVFLAIAFGGRSIVRIWAGPAAVPDPWLLMAINIWYLLSAWNMCSQTALNGMNHLAGQATYGSLFAILGLGVAWWAVPHYGVNGVVFSVVLLCTVLTGLAQRAELRRVLRRHLTGVSIPAMDDVFSTP
jgi:O-antigen/teichoic acid export membrane protein